MKLLVALMLLAAVPAAAQPLAPAADRWEKDISAFDSTDKLTPFPKGRILVSPWLTLSELSSSMA